MPFLRRFPRSTLCQASCLSLRADTVHRCRRRPSGCPRIVLHGRRARMYQLGTRSRAVSKILNSVKARWYGKTCLLFRFRCLHFGSYSCCNSLVFQLLICKIASFHENDQRIRVLRGSMHWLSLSSSPGAHVQNSDPGTKVLAWLQLPDRWGFYRTTTGFGTFPELYKAVLKQSKVLILYLYSLTK